MLILLIVLPWSIWREMRARAIAAEGLEKLPLIFAGVAVIVALTSAAPQTTPAFMAYNAAMAGRERFSLAPHIAQRPDGDPVKTFFLALYARDVRGGDGRESVYSWWCSQRPECVSPSANS